MAKNIAHEVQLIGLSHQSLVELFNIGVFQLVNGHVGFPQKSHLTVQESVWRDRAEPFPQTTV